MCELRPWAGLRLFGMKAAVAACALIILASGLWAKEPRRGPRALAIIELHGPPGALAGNPQIAAAMADTGRLFPVTILQDGVYFDGSVYQANPVPMMLEPGTVYDVERSGESLGTFTVREPGKLHRDWIARGDWHPMAAGAPVAPAKSAAAQSMESDDVRPTLRRSAEYPVSSGQAAGPAPSQGAAASAPVSPPQASNPEALDPDRPVLHRGKPLPAQHSGADSEATPPAASAAARSRATPPKSIEPQHTQFLVAISDASPSDARPYTFQWKPEEKTRLTKDVSAIARQEAQQYVHQLPGNYQAFSGLENVDVRAFDLFYDNDVELVLTARQSWGEFAAGAYARSHARTASRKNPPSIARKFTVLITVVAHSGAAGEMRKLFSSVTDDDHLDVIGRLDFIDAVDADGDGRGELLFRRSDDVSQSFEVYRVGRDQLWKLFEGAASSL